MVDGLPAFAAELAAAHIGFEPSRFEAVAAAEQQHFWFRARTQLIAWALHRHFPAARSLLEIGCGTGNVLAGLAAAGALSRLAGSEAHPSGLRYAARRLPGAELLQMDARHIPYRDEFDIVAAFDVIEHVDEDDAVIAEMFAACRPGGGILLSVPQHRWLWSYRDEFARHRRRFDRGELLRKLHAAGFERPWTTSFTSLLLPLMMLSRWRQRAATGFDPDSELRIGKVANRTLEAVMAVERGLIRARLPLLAGGSLLAIAHKA